MSEDQNDSPAFRLRPRRAAPKSYYTVRLEYSANPAAFIRERPRTSSKLRVFSRKSGSNATTGTGQNQGPMQLKPTVMSKEDQEREERRLLLHRDSRQSITTDTMISPFMQRLQLNELEPDSIYEHNYITLRIKEVEPSSNGRLAICLCHGTDSPNQRVHVRLYNEYADLSLVKREKIISIAKFRTGPSIDSELNTLRDSNSSSDKTATHPAAHNNGHSVSVNNKPAQMPPSANTRSEASRSPSVKSEIDEAHRCASRASDSTEPLIQPSPCVSPSIGSGEVILLPFHVIVRYDELVARATSNSNRNSASPGAASGSTSCTALGGPSVNRRPLVPFVSITSDMIEQPEEPFVEMSPPSPEQVPNKLNNRRLDDHENVDVKKVKFTANSSI